MKGSALQNKQVGVLRMAFRARKVFGTFEKRAPEHDTRESSLNLTSKQITRLPLLRFVVRLKILRQYFDQWEAKAKAKPIAPWTFPRFEQGTGNC